MELDDKTKIEQLTKALDRLIRFNKALIFMGAIETPKALEVELNLAWDVNYRCKD